MSESCGLKIRFFLNFEHFLKSLDSVEISVPRYRDDMISAG